MEEINRHTMISHDWNISPFVEFRETIVTLYQVDDDFKSLCDDYLTSKTSLEKFKDKVVEDKKLELEYTHLSWDLEKEILEYIIKRT